MDLRQAVLYGVNCEGGTFELGSHHDLYALLANEYSVVDGLIGIVIQTTGWMAPLDLETGETSVPPSEHPDRCRVVLVATLTTNGACSAVKSARHVPGAVLEETKVLEGPYSGALWDAMNECLRRMQEVAG